MNIELFATLVIAHVLGDFALQTDQIYRLKTQGGLLGLAVHVLLHLVAITLLIERTPQLLVFLLNLGLVHYAVDWIKLRSKSDRNALAFLIDQLAHFAHLVLLAWMFPDIRGIIATPWVYGLALYSFLPAMTMCLWVWAFDQEGRVTDSQLAAEWRLSMKSVSQAFGLPLVLGMMVSALFLAFRFLV